MVTTNIDMDSLEVNFGVAQASKEPQPTKLLSSVKGIRNSRKKGITMTNFDLVIG